MDALLFILAGIVIRASVLYIIGLLCDEPKYKYEWRGGSRPQLMERQADGTWKSVR